jgi:hypothetical protein
MAPLGGAHERCSKPGESLRSSGGLDARPRPRAIALRVVFCGKSDSYRRVIVKQGRCAYARRLCPGSYWALFGGIYVSGRAYSERPLADSVGMLGGLPKPRSEAGLRPAAGRLAGSANPATENARIP